MANDLCPNLDQFLPSRCQGPALDLSRQDQLSKEVPKVVGQDEEMQSDLVVVEFVARQPRPLNRILALLDPLLGGSPLIVKPDDPYCRSDEIRPDEAYPREQLAFVPFDLGDHSTGPVPALRLVGEVGIADQGRIRGTAHRPGQERLDLPLQDIVSRKADRVVVSFCLQELIEFRLGECGVGSKAAGKFQIAVAGYDRLQDLPPILSAVDVALPQDRAFDIAKLVETEEGVIAGAAEMPVIGRALLFSVGLADGAVHVEDHLPQLPMIA